MSNMSAGYDEQGRFASAQFGEAPLQWICLPYTMYMFSISNVYTCISYVYVNDRTGILRAYTPYSISCIENRSFLCFTWLGARHTAEFDILCICCVYAIHILTKIFWYTNYNIWICHVYVVYMPYIYWLKYFDIPTKIFWYAMYMLRLYNTYTD